MELSCPTCQSPNVQSVALAYANSSSVVYDRKNKAVGTQQTATGVALAPPQPKRMAWRWAIVVIFAFSALSTLGQAVDHPAALIGTVIVVALAALGIYLARKGQEYNREVYAPLYARWQRSFICHKCGQIFET